MKANIIKDKKRSLLAKTKTGSMVEHLSAVDVIVDIVVISLVAIVALCSLLPMWHVLMSSISDPQLLLAHKGMVWWPLGTPTLAGYKHLFEFDGSILDNDIIRGYLNTIFYTVATTALGFLISVTGGYALSRATKLKKFLIMFVMITMLFGGGLVPTYMVVRALGWVNTPWAVIVPGCTNAMFIIMMMNAFSMVPSEMYEAAKIDGASHFRILFQIMLPQARNMSTVIILNSVVGVWNSWFNAAIYLSGNRNLWPLQLFIREVNANASSFLQTANPDFTRYLIQYAAIIAACLPIIILFPFFQERMEKGALVGGVKG